MSVTNLEVIEDALRDINVISELGSASPEQGAYALRKLNQMMEEWKERSLGVGYFKQTATTGTCPIPDYAERAVTCGLSLEIAPKYGATISPEQAARIDGSISALKRKITSELLDNTDMTHMPMGQGHFGDGYYDINTDS